MNEILKKVKRRFIKESKASKEGGGLCYAAYKSLTKTEYEKFKQYLKKSQKGQKEFFTVSGEEVFDSSQFFWKFDDFESRINWLNLHITKTS